MADEIATPRVVTDDPAPRMAEAVPMPEWQRILVRVLRTYLQCVVGLLLAGGVSDVVGVPARDFATLLMNALSVSLAPAVVSLIHNGLEFLASIDETRPQVRG